MMVNRTASKSPPSTPQEANKDEKKTTTTTSGKKMKQTRLSFAAKDSGSSGSSDGLRKRKLSSPDAQPDRTVKIVRREGDPDDEPIVLIDDDDVPKEREVKEAVPAVQPAIVDDDQDAEMVEIIPCEDSNSAAAPSSTADVSLVEEEDEEEDDEEEDPINESINLDQSSSEEKGTAQENSFAHLLEPPANPSGKPLTPRQLEKFMEKKSRHEERLRQKVEREKKLEDERKQREERERQRRKEKEDREEAKRKEKEEKEAARLREKEEKETAKQREKEERDKKKQLEQEQKNEEKRKREEQKEEERRKKEEEKRQKEIEEETKRKRASQAFTKFFKVGPKTTDESGQEQAQAGNASSADDVVEVVHQYFMPFAVKGAMKLAPTVRRVLTKEAKGALDKLLSSGTENVQELYVKSLKTKSHVPLKGTKTWNSSDSSDDDSEDELMIVGEY